MGGWWPFGGGEKPNTTANSRVACYDHRDAYFECLDQNGEDSDKCKALEGKYRTACLVTWQKYFDLQHKKLKALGKNWESPNAQGKNLEPDDESLISSLCVVQSIFDSTPVSFRAMEGQKGNLKPVEGQSVRPP